VWESEEKMSTKYKSIEHKKASIPAVSTLCHTALETRFQIPKSFSMGESKGLE
jgi:hypothetical protein